MSEPSLKYCTKRDGYDDNWDGVSDAPYIDLECRFSDGQKFAAVRIDAEFPVLADKIANFLNAGTSDNKRLDEILSDALAGIHETDAAILAREVVRLREAPAVVVPQDCGTCGSYQDIGGDPHKCFGCTGDSFPNWNRSRSLASIRAIPADRVLGDGERRICSEELMYLRSLERYARKHGPESIQDVIGCLDHLRANQEGDSHG